MPSCLFRRAYDPAALFARHPPRLRHPHKQLVFELACPPGARHATTPIEVTRWAPAALPAVLGPHRCGAEPVPGYYDYPAEAVATWHVNFADPELFVAYGSRLLAQDELQCVEHPALGAIREALLAEQLPAATEEAGASTPVLVANVERRCELATGADLDAGRVYGLYGNHFAAATTDVVRRAVRVIDPPTRTNLIAIAAPVGSGVYFRAQIERILVTAYTGFAAAVGEGAVEIRTGFWGCGAFGGNRELMTLLQLLAAHLAGVARLRFHAFDDRGLADYRAGAAALDRVIAPGIAIDALIERIADLDYAWGESNGT
jgi:hypothetical protein